MEEMTTAELNAYLESIAEIIELKAQSPEEAAEIVRSHVPSTIKVQPVSLTTGHLDCTTTNLNNQGEIYYEDC